MPLYRWDDLNGYRTRTPGAGAPAPQAPAAPAPAPSSGGYVYSPDGTVSATGGWSANKGAADALGKASTAVGLVGLATQNRDLQQVGGVLGLGANLAGSKDAIEAGIAVGRYGAAQLGVPSYVSAPVLGGLQGYAREGTLEGATWGAARAGAGAVASKVAGAAIGGIPGLLVGAYAGGAVMDFVDDVRLGKEVDPNAPAIDPFGPSISARDIGASIRKDPDPIAALINFKSPAIERKDKDPDETELGAALPAEVGSAYSAMDAEAFGSAGWSAAVNDYSDARASREGRNEGSYESSGGGDVGPGPDANTDPSSVDAVNGHDAQSDSVNEGGWDSSVDSAMGAGWH